MKYYKFEKFGHGLRRLIYAAFFASVAFLLAGAFAYQPAMSDQRSVNIAKGFKATDLLLVAVQNLAEERGLTYTVLRSKQSPSAETLKAIKMARDQSIETFKQAVGLVKTDFVSARNERLTDDIESQLKRVQRLRTAFDNRGSVKRTFVLQFQWFETTTRAIETSNELMHKIQNEMQRVGVDAKAGRSMQLQRLVLAMSDYAGRERAVVSGAIAGQKTIPSAYKSLQQHIYRRRVNNIWRNVKSLASDYEFSPELNLLIKEVDRIYFGELENVRQAITAARKTRSPYPITASSWFGQSTAAIEKMLELARKAGHAAQSVKS